MMIIMDCKPFHDDWNNDDIDDNDDANDADNIDDDVDNDVDDNDNDNVDGDVDANDTDDDIDLQACPPICLFTRAVSWSRQGFSKPTLDKSATLGTVAFRMFDELSSPSKVHNWPSQF